MLGSLVREMGSERSLHSPVRKTSDALFTCGYAGIVFVSFLISTNVADSLCKAQEQIKPC